MDVFCKIVNGEIPSYTIYEDEIVKCFLDINPDCNGHTLIIPKKHYQDLYDIDNEVLNHIMRIAKELSIKIQPHLNCNGFTLIQNNGDVQEVKHFHLHLKPYYNSKQELRNPKDIYEILKEV